jgi:predicted MFS family arabinose efflux permease
MTIRGLVLLGVLTHSAFGGARVNLALFGLKLSGSTAQVGLLLSALALFPVLLSVTTGKWIDRVGSRPAILLGAWCLAIGNLLPFIWPEIPALFLCAGAIGIGFNFAYLGTQKLVGDLSRNEQSPEQALELNKKNFGYFALGFSVSGFCGPALVGVLIDHWGHARAFACLGCLPLLALLFCWRRLHDPVAPTQAQALKSNPFDLFKIPTLRRLFIAILVLTSAWDVHQFLVPLFGSVRGLTATQIGLVLGSFAVATFVVRLLMPLLADHLSEWGAIALALLIAMAVYCVYPHLPSFWWMFAVSFVLGLGLGISQPMTLALLHHNAPPGRVGEVTGVRMTLIGVSQSVFPSLFGIAGAALGLAPVFWAMSALSAIGAWAAWRNRRQPNSHDAKTTH